MPLSTGLILDRQGGSFICLMLRFDILGELKLWLVFNGIPMRSLMKFLLQVEKVTDLKQDHFERDTIT